MAITTLWSKDNDGVSYTETVEGKIKPGIQWTLNPDGTVTIYSFE